MSFIGVVQPILVGAFPMCSIVPFLTMFLKHKKVSKVMQKPLIFSLWFVILIVSILIKIRFNTRGVLKWYTDIVE